jgi:hypothetical protein
VLTGFGLLDAEVRHKAPSVFGRARFARTPLFLDAEVDPSGHRAVLLVTYTETDDQKSQGANSGGLTNESNSFRLRGLAVLSLMSFSVNGDSAYDLRTVGA